MLKNEGRNNSFRPGRSEGKKENGEAKGGNPVHTPIVELMFFLIKLKFPNFGQ
jgi:hypothetical protein